MRSGLFDVYAVESPTPMVTFAGGLTTAVMIENQRVEAAGTSGGGAAKIRRTWHPRWKATVNEQPVPVTQTGDGYMEVPVSAGTARLRVSYVVDGLDWLARILSLSGFASAVLLLTSSRFRTPSCRGRRWPHSLRALVTPTVRSGRR